MLIPTLLVSGSASKTVGCYKSSDYTLILPKISTSYSGFWSVQYWDEIVYVSSILDKIWKFNYDTRALIGSFDTVPLSSSDAPMYIHNGIIYLLQVSSGNVYKYDLDGNGLGSFNGGPAWVTWDMFVGNGYVYVYWAETWANEGRISKYTLDGVLQGTVNFFGYANHLFIDSEMIIANGWDTIKKLQVYTLGGTLLRESGIISRASAMHTVLATDSLIYVCNSYFNTVYVFDRSTLAYTGQFSSETAPVGVCFGKELFFYPPADPIDDNPDTLPDPGGDPQEITFRYETYKAIRSDESLLK